jgi:sialic acid synthase SpsE
MISSIRDTEIALGTTEKRVLDVENELYEKARRAIQSTKDIELGEQFTNTNTDILRPGEQQTGLAPKHYDTVLGKTASRDIQAGEGITKGDIEEDIRE